MISGKTTLIAHLGYPTFAFKAPLIYNPWFEKNGIDAAVIPMGVKPEEYREFFPLLFRMTNIRGALVTMPHKVVTCELVDELTPIAAGGRRIECGAASRGRHAARRPVRRRRLRPWCAEEGLRAARQQRVGGGQRRCRIADRRLAGRRRCRLHRRCTTRTGRLRRRSPARLSAHYPDVQVTIGSKDPEGFDLVANATPMGMNDGDPLPMDVDRISPKTFVADVVMKQTITPFLRAALDRGCQIQIGTDMLYEQIPAYLEFFGFGTATPDELRAVSAIPA